MIIQRRRVSNQKNLTESVGLLDAEESGFHKQPLSDDLHHYRNVKSWEALWHSKRSLMCVANDAYSGLEEDENDNRRSNTSKRKTVSSRNKPKNNKKSPLPKVESDDSNRSYREHCKRIEAASPSLKSCLPTPGFLLKSSSKTDDETEATLPPSPLSPDRSTEQSFDSQEDSPQLYSVTVEDDVLRESPTSIVSDIRYSLRTNISDGSRPQPPTANKRELRPNGVKVNVSHWSDKGKRHYMEDRYVIESMGAVHVELSSNETTTSTEGVTEVQQKTSRVKMPLTFLGVFDGHGGDKASQYCSDWMSSYIKNQPTYPHDLGYSMKDSYTTIDQDFCLSGHPDGTTACTVSLVGGKRIVCANAGDSRAIVIRKDGSVVRLSRDHKPGMSSEAKRISQLGGRVIFWQKRWRVEGLLAVSRGLGDASLKPYVSADPDVCEYDIQAEDLFLVISSDGVWDAVSNEEAAHVVLASSCDTTTPQEQEQMVIDTNRFKWAAKNLCNHARRLGSTDNFSAICVDLQSCGNPDATSGTYQPTTLSI